MINSLIRNDLLPAWIITRREVRDQFRDWRIIFPVAGLTLIFPFIMNWTAQRMLSFVNQYGATLIGERLVPFLLLIVGFFPISISLVIALESFVGEKERGSIEPLLNTPLKDWQIYVGKLLAATIPPLASSFLGMTVYLAGLAINGIPWPVPVMLVQIVTLTIVQAVMMVAGAVVVSAQSTSVRAANLLASFIIIPTAFLIQWEALVMFWGNFDTLWWVVFGVLMITILLVRIGLAHFRREQLLGREIDVLRLAWSLKYFWRSFTGGARGPAEWYRSVVWQTVRRLALPAVLIFGMAAAGVWVGAGQVERFPFLVGQIQNLDQGLDRLEEFLPLLDARSFFLIWWQNLRVLLLSMLLGLFSFGVIGVMPLMATMGIVGYLLGSFAQNGVDVFPIFAGLILPHGIIEIPVAVLATAAVLHAGAVLATPNPDRSIGEVWLEALADWAKVIVGVVIPLLFVAAAVEVWVTPQVAIAILGR